METEGLRVGDRVERLNVRPGQNRVAVIEDFGVKNGRVVVDLSDGSWAYLSQLIIRVPSSRWMK